MSDIVEDCQCILINAKEWSYREVHVIRLRSAVETSDGEIQWEVEGRDLWPTLSGIRSCAAKHLKRIDNYNPSLDEIAEVINDKELAK